MDDARTLTMSVKELNRPELFEPGDRETADAGASGCAAGSKPPPSGAIVPRDASARSLRAGLA